MTPLLAAFLVLSLAAAYPVAIYPVLVLLLARVRPRNWAEAPVDAPVVHLITVRDEQARIGAKLENALSLEVPAGGLRTVVVDDGSTDDTEAIVRRYADRGVVWLACPRRGKERAQIDAVAQTTEPLLVFSDAAALLEPEAVRRIVQPFADSAVDAVSGTDRLAGEAGGTGEDLYVRYEMAVRRAESTAGSLVGLSGCFFAARRGVAEQLLPDVPSDMGAALISIRGGRRAVAQDRAVAAYAATHEVGRELARKRRTALRGLRCLFSYNGVLSGRRPIVSWQVLSHKWLRFATPAALVGAGLVALVAAGTGELWGAATAAALLAGLLVAVVSLRSATLRRFRLPRAAAFFLVSNVAVLLAWTDVLRGRTRADWVPTERPGVGE